ncbi:MAG: hypothetical protein EBY07_14625, partial [Actinobacteria bacterium]|nr:hypothetical protein [Actinomycetota bacterium]
LSIILIILIFIQMPSSIKIFMKWDLLLIIGRGIKILSLLTITGLTGNVREILTINLITIICQEIKKLG